MEFKRYLDIYQILLSVFWLNILYSSVAYSEKGNAGFPYDLLAESSDNTLQKQTDKSKTDDEKKTLSQQVADGKYGLIHKELFSKPIQRPGIISYATNNEVPNDNASNLGGLNRTDIWLAENHLLVLKGGFYPLLESLPEYSRPVWPPIDDYSAPRRQVKLPKYPKVPPPFPVQLSDGGPLQILGTNFTRNINDTFFPNPYPIPPLEGSEPGNGPFYPPGYPYPPDATPGKAPFPTPPNSPTIPGNPEAPPLNIGGSILPPFFDTLPPGSAILPPPNITDQNDEDDLSIYYPPPYSFYYPTDNTTHVPPGPLVPGIVLPPPPDFFGPLHTSTTTTTTTPKPTPITKMPHRTKPSVTILKPVKTKPPPIYIYDNHIPQEPFPEYGPPPRNKVSIKTTKIPLRPYYNTSPKTEFIKHNKRPEKQFYYYNNNVPETNSISAQFPILTKNYINNSNNYIVRPHYYYLPTPTNNFKTHIVDLEEQIRSYENPANHFHQNTYKQPQSRPVYQYSFEVSNYEEQHNKLQNNRPTYTVQIEPAIEITTASPTYYQQEYNYQTPRAITAAPLENHSYRGTANPLYNVHTKQEDKLYDDMTKTYFTTFGKRIKSTTPLPLHYSVNKPATNVEAIRAVNVQNQHYQARPSIDAIIRGNAQRSPLYTKPNEETISIPNQSYHASFQNGYQDTYENNRENQQYIREKPVNPYSPIQQVADVQTIKAINIPTNHYLPIRQHKSNLNPYLHLIKPNIETIDAISIPTRQKNILNPYIHGSQQHPNVQAISIEPNNKPGSFISYQLPGDDGAHFYFLTPQLAQNADRQRIAYYYPQPSAPRLRRQR